MKTKIGRVDHRHILGSNLRKGNIIKLDNMFYIMVTSTIAISFEGDIYNISPTINYDTYFFLEVIFDVH